MPIPRNSANSSPQTLHNQLRRPHSRLQAYAMPQIRPIPRLGKRLGCHRCAGRGFSTSTRRKAGEVRIVEVGPRDGLQNESVSVPLETKMELLRRLARTGVRNIEAGSFVAPKWVPQVLHDYDCFPPCQC